MDITQKIQKYLDNKTKKYKYIYKLGEVWYDCHNKS